MNLESWLILVVSLIIVPSVAWLLKQVLDLRAKMIELETRLRMLDGEYGQCARHQKWAGDLQHAINKIDKNIGRLCLKAGVEESE